MPFGASIVTVSLISHPSSTLFQPKLTSHP
jgi:lysophospholipase L1-like esterase